ncbi:MAG: hypothetical protein J6K45_01430 [Clostridia bacterium]|nr:hypothetical protein [Clostridia bacterium]
MNFLQKRRINKLMRRFKKIQNHPAWKTSFTATDGNEDIKISIRSNEEISQKERDEIAEMIEKEVYQSSKQNISKLASQIAIYVFKTRKSVNILVSECKDEYIVLLCSITL